MKAINPNIAKSVAVTQPPPRVKPDPVLVAEAEKENKAKLEKLAEKKAEMEYFSKTVPRTGIEQPFLIEPRAHIR